MGNWIKKQMVNLAIAIGNVGKNTLSQEGISGDIETTKHRRLNQDSIMDSLLRGEITEDVEKLRWRIYKTITSIKKYDSIVIGYTNDGYPIMKTSYVGDSEKLSKIKSEPNDEYKLIMVVDNTNIASGVNTALNLDINIYDEGVDVESDNIINNEILNEDDRVNNDSDINLEVGKITTIGEVKDNSTELSLPIYIGREDRPKFELEKYTKKLHIKKINNKEFLLEFFISKYPVQFDKKSNFFLSDIKKIISQPDRYNSTVDIKTVSFITNNTLGSPDFLEFEYAVTKFDKITEFNGFYVIKFISDITIEGTSIIEKFRHEEVEEKYNNKEKR